MTESKWVYSLNGEDYETEEFDTKNEVIEYLRREWFELDIEEGTTEAFVAQVKEYKSKIDVDLIIEQLKDDAYDESPDYGDDYLEDAPEGSIQELGDKLNKVLQEWLEKYQLTPNFFLVKNEQKVNLRVDSMIVEKKNWEQAIHDIFRELED